MCVSGFDLASFYNLNVPIAWHLSFANVTLNLNYNWSKLPRKSSGYLTCLLASIWKTFTTSECREEVCSVNNGGIKDGETTRGCEVYFLEELTPSSVCRILWDTDCNVCTLYSRTGRCHNQEYTGINQFTKYQECSYIILHMYRYIMMTERNTHIGSGPIIQLNDSFT